VQKIPSWKAIAVPTKDIPVQINPTRYQIVSLEPLTSSCFFAIMDSGISKPKLVSMMGSDGNRYRVLIKGTDDLRQDGVMEQLLKVSKTKTHH